MNVRFRAAIALTLVFVVASARSARAQLMPTPPDAAGARVRLGPLRLNPSLSLTDIGVDTNLFNDADALNPKRDVALTFVPQTDIWMRAGRTWLTGNVRQDLVWFQDYRDERSANGAYRAGWVVPLTRVSLLVDGTWVRAKERSGFEIDARADRREGALSATTEVRALSRTFLGARAERRDIRFSTRSFFGGESLSEQLNRTRAGGAVTVRHEATPMTSLTAEVSEYHDRFALSPGRDANSIQAAGGVRFDPEAVIKGSVMVGYRRFTPASPDVPEYSGATVAANVSYVATTSTRVTLEAARDVEHSFENSHPYYLLNGIAGSFTQRVHGPLDVQGRVGFHSLTYRSRLNDATAPPERRDRITTLGGGFGYRLGRDLRLTFDVEQQGRLSVLALRNYSGIRYGMSVTYGL